MCKIRPVICLSSFNLLQRVNGGKMRSRAGIMALTRALSALGLKGLHAQLAHHGGAGSSTWRVQFSENGSSHHAFGPKTNDYLPR